MPKGIDPLRDKPELFAKRQRVHYHNSLLGRVVWTSSAMLDIASSDTTTAESKQLALEIYELSLKLCDSLKKRVD